MKLLSKPNRVGSIPALTSVFAIGAFLSSAALADEVSLKSADGSVNLVGEFMDFRDGNYIIQTALGELRLSASRVRCEGEACPDIEVAASGVVISGADTIGHGMMPLLLTGFASSLNAHVEVSDTPVEGQSVVKIVSDGGYGEDIGSYLVRATANESGFSDLLSGASQIGMASRRILPAEARELRASGAGNMVSQEQEHVIAIDSLVIITHPDNPLTELSMDDLREIYSGRITNWSSVGGVDAPIKVVSRQDASPTRLFFEAGVYDGKPIGSGIGHQIARNDQEAAAMVNEDETAIGYVGYAFQRGAKPLTLVNECGIQSRPNEFSAKTEEYALVRRMYLYNRSDRLDDEAKQFLDFTVSEAADAVVSKSGFIDLGIMRRAQDPNGYRAVALNEVKSDNFEAGVIREMLEAMTKSDRLSTTFRFSTGASIMDAKAQLDMARLIRFLGDQPEGTSITLVGFTDDVGAFAANRRLSVTRAEQVRKDMREAAGGALDAFPIDAIGFGEIAPSACNITDGGRNINRRVEVWITKNEG